MREEAPLKNNVHILINCNTFTYKFSMFRITMHQARAEGGAVGAWAPAPFPLDAQSALLSRQFFIFLFYFL